MQCNKDSIQHFSRLFGFGDNLHGTLPTQLDSTRTTSIGSQRDQWHAAASVGQLAIAQGIDVENEWVVRHSAVVVFAVDALEQSALARQPIVGRVAEGVGCQQSMVSVSR